MVSKYWVVWCQQKGAPTKKHSTAAAARVEAERLAALHGIAFDVLVVEGRCTPEPVKLNWEYTPASNNEDK
jgi:hypothetical protein